MQNESREDLLEALCLMEREGSPHPAVADLARRISRDEKEIRGHLEILSEKGDLILQGDLIEITSQGREIGSRIMRKHRVLECFFTEMLGMEPKAASSEACALEHGISDEVVDRIGNYMEGPGTQASRRQPGEIRRVRTLLEFPEGMELDCQQPETPQRLAKARGPWGLSRTTDHTGPETEYSRSGDQGQGLRYRALAGGC